MALEAIGVRDEGAGLLGRPNLAPEGVDRAGTFAAPPPSSCVEFRDRRTSHPLDSRTMRSRWPGIDNPAPPPGPYPVSRIGQDRCLAGSSTKGCRHGLRRDHAVNDLAACVPGRSRPIERESARRIRTEACDRYPAHRVRGSGLQRRVGTGDHVTGRYDGPEPQRYDRTEPERYDGGKSERPGTLRLRGRSRSFELACSQIRSLSSCKRCSTRSSRGAARSRSPGSPLP